MARDKFELPKRLDQKMFLDASLYYDREDFLANSNKINNYLEIGVLAGDYTDLVIKYMSPSRLDLIDPYDKIDWNQLSQPRFDKKSHYEYVKNKYSNQSGINIIKKEFRASDPDMKELNNQYDYIYLDADHSENFMIEALEFSKSHISVNGIIGINDYMIFDHFNDEYYGTVQATNKFLLENSNFKIHAYVLGAALHPDIYLKRIS